MAISPVRNSRLVNVLGPIKPDLLEDFSPFDGSAELADNLILAEAESRFLRTPVDIECDPIFGVIPNQSGMAKSAPAVGSPGKISGG